MLSFKIRFSLLIYSKVCTVQLYTNHFQRWYHYSEGASLSVMTPTYSIYFVKEEQSKRRDFFFIIINYYCIELIINPSFFLIWDVWILNIIKCQFVKLKYRTVLRKRDKEKESELLKWALAVVLNCFKVPEQYSTVLTQNSVVLFCHWSTTWHYGRLPLLQTWPHTLTSTQRED